MPLKKIFLAGAFCLTMTPAISQSFTCGFSDRPACLGYGDTVCSSSGKCVNDDALCFDRYQCDYEGFTCRSNVTACVDDYNDLLQTYNQLVEDYNGLLDDLRNVRTIAQELEDMKACLIYANTVEDARFCAR